MLLHVLIVKLYLKLYYIPQDTIRTFPLHFQSIELFEMLGDTPIKLVPVVSAWAGQYCGAQAQQHLGSS